MPYCDICDGWVNGPDVQVWTDNDEAICLKCEQEYYNQTITLK